MIIGSISGWLTLAGSTARPAAISSRTSSGATFSRMATNSISGVTIPARAYAELGRPAAPCDARGRRTQSRRAAGRRRPPGPDVS